MKSKALVCAIAAASLGMASLSFAQGYQGYGRPGQGYESPRGEQRGPMDRDGRDAGPRGPDPRYQQDSRDNRGNRDDRNGGPRGFDRRDARNDWQYGARGPQFYRGGHIPPEYRNRQYVVNDWQTHRLSPPPRGQQWVQVGADYALIAIATGVIAQLVLNH